jgi:hypothetical protein
LTIAKLECRRTTWAEEAREFSNKTSDALKAITPTVERHARLSGDRHFGKAQWRGPLISLSNALEAGGVFRRIHFGRRYIRKVGDKEVKVWRIPRGAAGEEWLSKVAVKEGDSRGNPRTKCV